MYPTQALRSPGSILSHTTHGVGCQRHGSGWLQQSLWRNGMSRLGITFHMPWATGHLSSLELSHGWTRECGVQPISAFPRPHQRLPFGHVHWGAGEALQGRSCQQGLAAAPCPFRASVQSFQWLQTSNGHVEEYWWQLHYLEAHRLPLTNASPLSWSNLSRASFTGQTSCISRPWGGKLCNIACRIWAAYSSGALISWLMCIPPKTRKSSMS